MGDQAYQGQAAVLAERAPRAVDRTNRRWRSKLQVWPEQRERNRVQSKTRSRVEHVFGVLKLRFGFVKVRYRGHAKNLNRLLASCALVHLVTAQKHLLAVRGQECVFESAKPRLEDTQATLSNGKGTKQAQPTLRQA